MPVVRQFCLQGHNYSKNITPPKVLFPLRAILVQTIEYHRELEVEEIALFNVDSGI